MTTNPSVLMQFLVAEKYGPRLNMDQLAELLGIARGTLHNQVSAGKFPIATYLDQGRRWADCRDVAAHLDACRERARVAA